VALGRWPTTIGGWKTIEKSDGSMALKYKESVTGEAVWPEILATPTWHPAPGIPTRRLLIKRGDLWVPGAGSSATHAETATNRHGGTARQFHDQIGQAVQRYVVPFHDSFSSARSQVRGIADLWFHSGVDYPACSAATFQRADHTAGRADRAVTRAFRGCASVAPACVKVHSTKKDALRIVCPRRNIGTSLLRS